MKLNMIDNHCFLIFQKWVDGDISKEEAEKQMSIHGDRLVYDMFNNGFNIMAEVDFDSFKGIVGSSGS